MAGTCTGECIKCSFQQQIYCGAQLAHGIIKNQEAIVARLDALDAKVSGFGVAPSINPLEQKAHVGPGAENRGPETNTPSQNGL